MAKESRSDSNVDPFKQPVPQVQKIRANAARAPKGINPVAVANERILYTKKTEIRYKNGVTLPISAEKLLADARNKSLKHSAILSDNMMAEGQTRPKKVAAHHIVSWRHREAFAAQELLFGWGIGINDVDNGVYLPRFKRTFVDTLPDARKHAPLHTYIYYEEVYMRLVRVGPERENSEAGRQVLRGIKAALVDGTFPYLEEHQL